MKLALALLLLGACAKPTPDRDDPALATARFRVELQQPGRLHELELRCPDGHAAVIWSTSGDGERRGTTRLDLRQARLPDLEFTVDPLAELAVCLRDGTVVHTHRVLLLPRTSTRLRL